MGEQQEPPRMYAGEASGFRLPERVRLTDGDETANVPSSARQPARCCTVAV